MTKDLAPDVLEGHQPRASTNWRPPPRLVMGGLTVALLGGLAFFVAQDDTGSAVVDASGSMVVDHRFSEAADRPRSTQMEDKNASFSGPIRLVLPDGELIGHAELSFSFAGTFEEDVVWIWHTWGKVHATFDSTICSGPFAWSVYKEPPDTGGSLSLRCDDGSLFAATALVEGDEAATAERPYRVLVTLVDGSFVAS